MGSTAFSAVDLGHAATKLKQSLADMSAFSALASGAPNAGPSEFSRAAWLEKIAADRCSAIVAHAHNLHTAFDQLSTALTRISKDFPDADGDNATKIKKALTDAEGKADKLMTTTSADSDDDDDDDDKKKPKGDDDKKKPKDEDKNKNKNTGGAKEGGNKAAM